MDTSLEAPDTPGSLQRLEEREEARDYTYRAAPTRHFGVHHRDRPCDLVRQGESTRSAPCCGGIDSTLRLLGGASRRLHGTHVP